MSYIAAVLCFWVLIVLVVLGISALAKVILYRPHKRRLSRLRWETDARSGAAYLTLSDEPHAKTIPVGKVEESAVNVDFDAQGRVIGLEIYHREAWPRELGEVEGP